MERQIDFSRERQMLCATCDHRWTVDLNWIDRWNHSRETCPGCGTNCESEHSPRMTVDPNDVALDDREVARFAWYHTSTQPDWPTRDYDPAAELTVRTRKMMGGDKRVAEWAARQRAKALHVGTYEAAIHNMLRRIRDQADRGSQFHLYRVHLRPSVAVRSDWLIDPSNFVGDVVLAEVCPPGVDVARYLNYHEDPGRLSLALGRGAIASVQQVAVPFPVARDADWVQGAVATLVAAPGADVSSTGGLGRPFRPFSPRATLARELAGELTERLPVGLRDEYTSATSFTEGDAPEQWATRTSCLFDLINDPGRILAALDQQEKRAA